MTNWRFKRTTLITVGLIAFLGGLGLAHANLTIAANWMWLAAFLTILTFRHKQIVSLLAIILFGLTFGLWRGGNYMHRLVPYKQLVGQKVVMIVTAESDGVYDQSQLSFDGGDINVRKPNKENIPGQITVKGFGEAAIYRGDKVQVEGKIFSARGSKQAKISFAELKVVGRSSSPIESLRLRFLAGMQNALPEPLASFGLGLLIGQRSTLPEEVNRDLAIVGLTHIVAVSGYNLTIIIRGARRLLEKRSKYQALVLSLFLIASFLLFTGFSASIVRAAIVSTLGLLAWFCGRKFRPILLISLTAAITAGWYPLYLWSDIGWYLSFLAFFGVLVLAPIIVKRFYKRPQPNGLTLIITESFCAQIMTLPLILFIFKQVSLISLLANALVVPLVPLAMLMALMAGVSGMFWPVLAGWIAWPARILLTYMLDLIRLLARWPHALVERSWSLSSMLVMYGCLLVICLVMWRRLQKNARVTDIKAEDLFTE